MGSAPGLPVAGQHHACVWFNWGSRNVIFDCGDGAASRLTEANLGGDVIDHIVISHLHPDHVCGLFMVLQMFYLQGRRKQLDIFLPERIQKFTNIVKFFYLYPKRFGFDLTWKSCSEVGNTIPGVTALANDHLLKYRDRHDDSDTDASQRSYSFLLCAEGKKIMYTSDISSVHFLRDIAADLDLMIIDSLHVPREDLYSMAALVKGRTVLNHGSLQGMKALVAACPTLNLIAAREDEEIIL